MIGDRQDCEIAHFFGFNERESAAVDDDGFIENEVDVGMPSPDVQHSFSEAGSSGAEVFAEKDSVTKCELLGEKYLVALFFQLQNIRAKNCCQFLAEPRGAVGDAGDIFRLKNFGVLKFQSQLLGHDFEDIFVPQHDSGYEESIAVSSRFQQSVCAYLALSGGFVVV